MITMPLEKPQVTSPARPIPTRHSGGVRRLILHQKGVPRACSQAANKKRVHCYYYYCYYAEGFYYGRHFSKQAVVVAVVVTAVALFVISFECEHLGGGIDGTMLML